MKTHLRNFAVLTVVTFAMILLYGRIEYTEEPFSHQDLAKYRAIAAASPQLDTSVPQPFAYRLLGPYIVGLLPLPDPLGFYLFAVAMSFLVVFLLYSFLHNMGLSASTSVIAAILFTFNKYLFGFTVWNFFRINDLLTLVYLIMLFGAMMRSNWLVFGLVMLLGAFTKEVAMILIPVVFIYLFEQNRLSAQGRYALLAVVPAIVVFLSLRWLIPAPGLNLFQAFRWYSVKLYSAETWFRLLVNSFIPLSLMPLVFIDKTLGFFKGRKYALAFVVLVFFSTLFGINNERLMAPAFLVFYWLIGAIIDGFIQGGKKLTLLVILSCTFLSSLHHNISVFDFMSKNLTIIVSLGALVMVTTASIISRMGSQSRCENQTRPKSDCRSRPAC